MLLQTNSYIVPKEKRVEHARLLRRFRQMLARLGCDHFEVFEQVGANWNIGEATGRYVQIMKFRDRKHQTAVQTAERSDPAAQAVIADFCRLINFPYQQQQGLFAIGFYTSALPSASVRTQIHATDAAAAFPLAGMPAEPIDETDVPDEMLAGETVDEAGDEALNEAPDETVEETADEALEESADELAEEAADESVEATGDEGVEFPVGSDDSLDDMAVDESAFDGPDAGVAVSPASDAGPAEARYGEAELAENTDEGAADAWTEQEHSEGVTAAPALTHPHAADETAYDEVAGENLELGNAETANPEGQDLEPAVDSEIEGSAIAENDEAEAEDAGSDVAATAVEAADDGLELASGEPEVAGLDLEGAGAAVGLLPDEQGPAGEHAIGAAMPAGTELDDAVGEDELLWDDEALTTDAHVGTTGELSLPPAAVAADGETETEDLAGFEALDDEPETLDTEAGGESPAAEVQEDEAEGLEADGLAIGGAAGEEAETNESESEVGEAEGGVSEVDEAEDDEAEVDEAEVGEAEVDEAEVDEDEVDEAEADEAELDEAEVDEAEADETEADETEADETEVDEAGVHGAEADVTEADETTGVETASDAAETDDEAVGIDAGEQSEGADVGMGVLPAGESADDSLLEEDALESLNLDDDPFQDLDLLDPQPPVGTAAVDLAPPGSGDSHASNGESEREHLGPNGQASGRATQAEGRANGDVFADAAIEASLEQALNDLDHAMADSTSGTDGHMGTRPDRFEH